MSQLDYDIAMLKYIVGEQQNIMHQLTNTVVVLNQRIGVLEAEVNTLKTNLEKELWKLKEFK